MGAGNCDICAEYLNSERLPSESDAWRAAVSVGHLATGEERAGALLWKSLVAASAYTEPSKERATKFLAAVALGFDPFSYQRSTCGRDWLGGDACARRWLHNVRRQSTTPDDLGPVIASMLLDWRDKVIGTSGGSLTGRLCADCRGILDHWWEANIDERIFEAEDADLPELRQLAEQQGYSTQYPIEAAALAERWEEEWAISEDAASKGVLAKVKANGFNVSPVTFSREEDYVTEIDAWWAVAAREDYQRRFSGTLARAAAGKVELVCERLCRPRWWIVGLGGRPGRWRFVAKGRVIAKIRYRTKARLHVVRIKPPSPVIAG